MATTVNIVRSLMARGVSQSMAAEYAGISKQRAHQIAHNKRSNAPALRQQVIYFVQVADYIKIGVALDLERRLKQIECHCPLPVVLLGTMKGSRATEAGLHQRFTSDKHRGEWFHANQKLIAWIAQNTTGGAVRNQ